MQAIVNFPVSFQPSQEAQRDMRRAAMRSSTYIQQQHVEPHPSMETRHHTSLPTWSYHKVNDDTGSSFQARFLTEQGAWNPFHLTGVPEQPGGSTVPPPEKRRRVDPNWKFPQDRYDTVSEIGSTVAFLAPPDSGYGSRSGSSSTRSIVSSAYATETTPSCQIPHNDDRNNDQIGVDIPSINDSSSTNDALVGLSGPVQPPEVEIPYQNRKKCDYPGCKWTGKCPSDKRKHEARHKKQFKCDEPNCTRKDGFGTINDLERHKKCVHHKVPDRGPKKKYMCFGENCPRENKLWPRLDNFRQHLIRIHSTEDQDLLLRRSDEWYSSWLQDAQQSSSVPRPSPPREELFPSQNLPQPESSPEISGGDSYSSDDNMCTLISPRQTMNGGDSILGSCEDLTLSPIKNCERFECPSDQTDTSRSACLQTQGIPGFHQEPVELPALKSLNLHPIGQDPPSGAMQEQLSQLHQADTGKASDAVNEVATRFVDMLSKSIDTDPRRKLTPSEQGGRHGISMEPHVNAVFYLDKKVFLREVISAALEQLQDPTSHDTNQVALNPKVDDKEEWFQCDECPKMTRLKCELKKHKKRHEKPYGCTFPKCPRKFGSKGDWKRHENSQHFYLQSWRCTFKDTTGMECARLFTRQELYIQHLRKNHEINGHDAKYHLRKNQIGRNNQYQFWCGFCRKIVIPSKNRGLDAWNERFNHIDIEHFKRGERIEDWLPPEGHLTNNERDQEQRKRAAEKISTSIGEVILDDSSSNSDTSSTDNNGSRAGSAEDNESHGDTAVPTLVDDSPGDSDVEFVMEIVEVRTDSSRPPAIPGLRKRKSHNISSDSPEYAAMTDVQITSADQNEKSSRGISPGASSPNPTDSVAEKAASRLFSVRAQEQFVSADLSTLYCCYNSANAVKVPGIRL
ncbi:hypothetical protein V8E54_000502 [Elaphomyces granulatus]